MTPIRSPPKNYWEARLPRLGLSEGWYEWELELKHHLYIYGIEDWLQKESINPQDPKEAIKWQHLQRYWVYQIFIYLDYYAREELLITGWIIETVTVYQTYKLLDRHRVPVDSD